MLKTYLYVPKELNTEIINLAAARKTSKAEVIRNALEEGIDILKRKETGSLDVLYKVADIGRKINAKGPKDLSKNLDKYLWDEYK